MKKLLFSLAICMFVGIAASSAQCTHAKSEGAASTSVSTSEVAPSKEKKSCCAAGGNHACCAKKGEASTSTSTTATGTFVSGTTEKKACCAGQKACNKTAKAEVVPADAVGTKAEN